MNRAEILYLAPYLFSLALSLGVFIYTWQHRDVHGARVYAWFAGGQTLAILGFIFELISPSLPLKILWDKFQWIVESFLVILPFLIFAVQYSEYKLRRPMLAWGYVLAFLVGFTVLLLTDDIHHLLYPNPQLSPDYPFPELQYDFTWVVYVYALLYLYGANFYGLSLLIKRALQPHNLHRLQYWTIVVGFSIPLFLTFFSLADIRIAPQRDNTPFALAIGNLIVAWGLFRYRLFDIVPIAREHIVENMIDPVVVLDINNQVVDINPAALQALGIRATEAVGRSSSAVFARWSISLDQLENLNGERQEVMIEEAQGTRFYDLNTSAIHNKRHQRMGYIIVAHDITSHKTLEAGYRALSEKLEQRVQERTEELRHSAERYRAVVEHQTEFIVRWKANGVRTFVNEAYCRYFGVTSEQALSTSFMPLVAEEDRPAVEEKISRLKSGAVNMETETHRVIKPDGSLGWQEWTDQAIRDDMGNLIEFQSVGRDITERKQAEAALQRRADEFAALYENSLDLAVQQDLPTLLDTILKRAMGLFAAPSSAIFLYDAARHDLELAAVWGVQLPVGTRLAWGEGMAGRVAQTRQPLIVDNYSQWEHHSPKYEGVSMTASMQAPMLSGGVLIGVLDISELQTTTRKFTEADVRLLTLFAGQAASAVHNARQVKAIRQRLAELEAVGRVSAALRAADTLDEMLPGLLDETLAVLSTEAGSITLYDPAQDKIKPVVGRGWMATIEQSSLTPGEGIVGQVFVSGEIYRVREFATNPLTHASARPQIPLGWGGVCLPIRTAQETVGVMFISVQLPRELTDDEIHLLTTLAEIAGNAIHRARLYEQTEHSLERLAALRVIDQAITSSIDLSVTLNILLRQTLLQLKADAACVLRLNSQTQTLGYIAGQGFHTTQATQSHLQLGEGYAGRAALERRLISLPDLTTANPLFVRVGLVVAESLRAYHVTPLIVKGQVTGVLEVFHHTLFQPDPEWLDFLEALAGQAAIAMDSADLFESLQHSNLELRQAYDATIEGWSRALDLRDRETEGHSQRVTEMTVRLAQRLNLSETELVHIRRGALLHDIGKMGVPDRILLKSDQLTEAEWTLMKAHPQLAYDMLSPIDFLRSALDIPYCHHEKWDGTGYPRGLKGEQIPLAARLFAVVDVWDALRSDRPYRPAWPPAQVLEHIRQQAGTHFDPKVVETFVQIVVEGT